MIDVIYDSVKSYLERHFNPDEIVEANCTDVGTILHSRDSTKWTNATVIGLDPDARFRQVMVLTDIGNVMYLTYQEMNGIYSLGKKRVLRDPSQTWLPTYHDVDTMGQLKYTYKDLLAKANEATGIILSGQGYELVEGATFHDAMHPHDKWVFDTVCRVIETLHPNVDMEDVISYANDSE